MEDTRYIKEFELNNLSGWESNTIVVEYIDSTHYRCLLKNLNPEDEIEESLKLAFPLHIAQTRIGFADSEMNEFEFRRMQKWMKEVTKLKMDDKA